MPAAFRPRKTFEAELRAQPEFQAARIDTAVKVAASIRLAALPYRNTGYFIRKVRARRFRVLLLDNFWHIVEFGSVHNPPQRNGLRGVRALGMRYEDGRVDEPGPAA